MGNGEKECFDQTDPFDDGNDDDGDEDDEVSELGKNGSSSSSTVEESEKNKPAVRPYVRSKMPRLRWTPDLHLRFMNAVERLGGQERATPKLVLQFMGIKGLNISHVKSHLQMYRSKRIDESNQGMKDQRFIMEGVDRNIYNLSQLPLLPNFNQRQNYSNISFPRNGDASWNGHGKWMHNSSIGQNNKTRPGGYYGNNLDSHYYNNRSSSANNSLHLFSKTSPSFVERSTWRTNNELPKLEKYYGSLLHNQEPLLLGQCRQNPIERVHNGGRVSSDHTHTSTSNIRAGLKRKNSDFVLDLNLSLAVESRNNEEQRGILPVDDDYDEELGLSLYTSPSSSSKMVNHKKLKEDIVGNENARGASTLDLTL